MIGRMTGAGRAAMLLAAVTGMAGAAQSAGQAAGTEQSAARTASTGQSSPRVAGTQPSQQASISPATLARIGKVEERYQSYNVEMLEVTGGRFWKPYKDIGNAEKGTSGTGGQGAETPAGMDPGLYQYRPPLDLANPRLRAMAKALAPAYMRVSGTWANTTYFADTDNSPKEPPPGYGGVLTRQQWLAAIDFSNAVDAPIVTSMPTGTGTRDANGSWQADQSRRWLAFTKEKGGTIAAAEFMNEPTFATMGGAPEGYDAEAFGRDYRVFNAFMRKEYPGTRLIAPGSVGEAEADWNVASGGYGKMKVLPAADLAASTGDADAFSYHHYGAVSLRCKAMGHQTSADEALTEDWLGRTDVTLDYYRKVRDRFMPGKPFWNTETADAACGGNPWGGQFLDTFRYLDQMGRLARQEVEVVVHNTLVASDYGLLDENTFEPKPNYWGALLWRRLMGTVVLDSGVPIEKGRHVYAHCLRGQPGGVALLVINNDRANSTTLKLDQGGQRYTLTSPELQSRTVHLNGKPLALGAQDQLPAMSGEAISAGEAVFAPASISFIALRDAKNPACM
jgi:heparanase 1